MTDLVIRAEAIARKLHAGQTRKGATAEPYIVHVAEVAALVAEWGGGPEAVAAAWLHDTVEDCPPYSLEEIASSFGGTVAGLVAEMTDDKSLPKLERKRLQQIHAPHASPRAAVIKLADKTANVDSLAYAPPVGWDQSRLLGYVDWAEGVVAALPPGLPQQGLTAFRAAAARARNKHAGFSLP